MSPKNLYRPCHAFFALLIVSILSLASCKKDDLVAPGTPATADTVSVPNKNFQAAAITITNTDVATYVSSGVINLTGAHDITISGKSIVGGAVAAISLTNCYNITITGNKLYNSSDVGIYLLNCRNIKVVQNFITNVSTGVYVDHSASGGIIVNQNQFLNMKGPFPRGQFVQFNNVNGPNNQIIANKGENILGQSHPEDAISLYQSNGTAASPIKIDNNQIRGGGPSASGGGIMLGDSGGSYLSASGNTLVNPGQYGMAISGGSHNCMMNNVIYGVSQAFTNIGMYVETIGTVPVTNSTVSGNLVKFYNAKGVVNGAWLASGLVAPSGWSSNNWNAGVNASVLPATLITDH